MKVRRKTVAALAVTITALVAVTGLAGAGSATTGQGQFLAGVVSDVGRFNDKGFNQLSLQGCKSGAKKAGGTCRGLESRSTADYIPNFVKLQREGADISIATRHSCSATRSALGAFSSRRVNASAACGKSG